MSKAIEENELTVKIKRVLREFNLYWTNQNNEKKMNLPTLPFRYSFPLQFCSVTVFLIAEKIISLYDFEIFRLSVCFY